MGAVNGIGTRQQSGALFERVRPLGAAASVQSPAFDAAGLARLVVSSFADTSHQIVLEEANGPDGPWTTVETLTSAPIGGGLERLAGLVFPIGAYMRATLTNLGAAQQTLSALIIGLPT